MAKSIRGVKQVKFSVIIPVYNAEQYIEECANSVLHQTYKDFEVVLVDDGSTDKSGSICDCLKRQYGSKIKVVHQENKGQLLSRCVGVEKAQGEYCVFVDADDIFYEKSLEILSKTIDEYSSPDIIGYKLEKLSQLGEKICRDIPLECNVIYSQASKKIVYEKLMLTAALNSMCNKCIKRACLVGCEERFLEYKSLRCAEDRLQVLESVTRAQTIVFINETLYCYRLFSGSVTRNFHISQIEKINMNLLYFAEKDYLRKWELDYDYWVVALKNRWLNETIYTFSNFYENAKNSADRKAIVNYDWDSFLPGDFSIEEVKGGNANSVLLYKKIKEKDYTFLRLYFLKKLIYKKYKKIKARIKGL